MGHRFTWLFITKDSSENSVFLYGHAFCTKRGGGTKYSLVPKQVARFPPDIGIYESNVYYEYTEFISNQHRYKDINTKNKVIRAYAQIGNEHCIVKLLDAHLAKLKPDSSFFYMHPLEKVPEQHGKSWYTSQQVG